MTPQAGLARRTAAPGVCLVPMTFPADNLFLILQSQPALLTLVQTCFDDSTNFSRGQLENIATAVSRRNRVSYCVAMHSHQAAENGMGPDVPTEPKMLAVMKYALALTEMQSNLPALEREVRGDGWNDEDLHRLVMLVAFVNMMNRVVEAATKEG